MADINIKNCNNIDEGTIKIIEGCLNIKYGINGTGKSTISNAIKYYFEDQQNEINNIKKLLPYKHQGNITTILPSIEGLEIFKKVAIFNEQYLSNTVFKQKEVIKGSFEVFVKDQNYDTRMKEIEDMIKGLGDVFQNDENINHLIDHLESLGKQAKTTQSGGLHGSSEFIQAFENGNLIENIPPVISCYNEYIKNSNRAEWITWQIQGNKYLDIINKCPCCAVTLNNTQKDNIKEVHNHYDKRKIGYLENIIKNFELLKDYFDPGIRENIEGIIKKGSELTEHEKNYIIQVKNEADGIVKMLKNIKLIGFSSLKNEDNIEQKIKDSIIDEKLLHFFKSDLFIQKITLVNQELNNLISNVRLLLGKIKNHKTCIKGTIEKNKKEIDSFLYKGGYKYCIDSTEDGDSYKIILKHRDSDVTIDESNNGLSFGERNAFSLVLFMFQAISEGADLIILDDPISSFDENKKFAILDMLFSSGKENLLNKTVLMLTHDFEPVIDIVYNELPSSLENKAYAHFITNKNGILSEKSISREDISLCTKLSEKKIMDTTINVINKLVYLRRLYELINKKGDEYNLISNLIHKKSIKFRKKYNPTLGKLEDIKMTDEEVDGATLEIQKYLPDFNYDDYLAKIKDTKEMIALYFGTTCLYEKMQLYRILFEEESLDPQLKEIFEKNKVLKKFINETFHIENDDLFQLDPQEYDIIPPYIIEECDSDINKISV